MVQCKKTIFGEYNKPLGKMVVVKKTKEGADVIGLSMPPLTRGTPISVGFVDKASPCGFNFEAAWVLEELAPRNNEMPCVLVSFGRKSKRKPMVIPFTSIHAHCLAGKRTFAI